MSITENYILNGYTLLKKKGTKLSFTGAMWDSPRIKIVYFTAVFSISIDKGFCHSEGYFHKLIMKQIAL